MATQHMKGKQARNFIAVLMVDADGESALEKCTKDGPMYKAVKAEIEYRKEADKAH